MVDFLKFPRNSKTYSGLFKFFITSEKIINKPFFKVVVLVVVVVVIVVVVVVVVVVVYLTKFH